MIKEAIVKIVNKEDLTYKEAYDVMNEIMNGETSEPSPGLTAKIVLPKPIFSWLASGNFFFTTPMIYSDTERSFLSSTFYQERESRDDG